MKYIDMVKADILQWIADNRELLPDDLSPTDDNITDLYDMLWDEDSVTGNASGSYTCNSYKAKEYVFDDIDAVLYGLEDLCVQEEIVGRKFMAKDWEWFDVIARLGRLYWACEEALKELSE